MSCIDHLSELEALRLQVADLTRALAERDHPASADLLRAIVEGTASDIGEEFFRSLVKHLAQTLNVRYAFVGEWCQASPTTVRTMAVWSGAALAEPFEYTLRNTPCDNVVNKRSCLYASGVQRLFPEDHLLVQMEVDSYCGTPLFDQSGKPLGILVVMDDRPMLHAALVKDLLQVFGARAAAELQRRQAEAALHESEQRLHFTQFAVDHAQDGVLWTDGRKRFVYANEAACRLLGYSNEELLNLNRSDIAPYHDPSRFQQPLNPVDQGTAVTYESNYRRKDGSEVPVEASVTFLWHKGQVYACEIIRDITDRTRIEQERAQALADLHNVIEAIPDIVFALDCQGNMVKWNRRVVDVTGYSPEELRNKPALAFVLPEEQARTAAAIQQAFTEGYAELEGHLLTKDHRRIPYHWTGARLVNTHGELVGITGIGRDVSDKKRVEEALQKSEERLALAAEGSNDVLWDAHRLPNEPWYAPQTPVWWSTRVRGMLGLEESEPFETLEQWAVRLHPDDKDRVFGQLAAHIEQRVPFDVEYRLRHNRGDYLWIRGRGQALWDEQGEVRRMSGSCQDITDRKRAEEAIGDAELRYRTIFEQAGAGVAQIESHTGRFVQINRRYCEIVGLTEAEMMATAFGVITHPDDLQSDLENMTRLLRGEVRSFTMEKRYVRPDGDIVWVNLNVAPLWRAGEQPSHHIAIVEDITERKQTEEALYRSEYQMRTVLDALPVGVWFTDQSGRPVLSNPAARQIWSGIKQVGVETPDGNSGWWERVGPSDRFHRWALSHSLTKGIPSLSEALDLECFDGRIKTIRNTTVPVQSPNGDILGAIVLNEDITMLRQAQEALKLTQFSVDRAVEGFFWIRQDARILQANEAACRMLEYTRDELLAITFLDIDPSFPPESWPAYWDDLKRKGSMTFESKHWSRTGRVLETEVTLNYLQYEGKEYACAIMRDIRERKRAEEELRESHAFIRQVINGDPNFIFAKDREGRFTLANKAVADAYGTTVESLIGKTDADFNPNQEEVASFRQNDLSVLDSLQDLFIPEEIITDSTGRTRWLQTVKRPILDERGRAIMMLGTATDITERKRMEETLRQRERALRMALDERERISQDLHDGILQSLFAVGLTLETTKSKMSSRTRKLSGSPLDQAIKQLNLVMREIRNFIAGLGSDLLKGKDLPAVLQHMLAMLTENQATHVRLAVEDRAAKALSTEQSLHLLRVIQEAVGNCIRHGRAQEARVSLKMLKQGVRLSIRDDGRGFNLSAAKGAGHGLTNMAARAQKIGGRLTILSKVNEGTRVVLDLPNEAVLAVH